MNDAALICARLLRDGTVPRVELPALAHPDVRQEVERQLEGVGLVLAICAHTVGWPFPRGGAQRIPDALAAYLRTVGGTIVTGSPLTTLPNAPIVMCDVTPLQLLALAGHAPATLLELGGWDQTLASVAELLADPTLSGPAKAEFREIVRLLVRRWARSDG